MTFYHIPLELYIDGFGGIHQSLCQRNIRIEGLDINHIQTRVVVHLGTCTHAANLMLCRYKNINNYFISILHVITIGMQALLFMQQPPVYSTLYHLSYNLTQPSFSHSRHALLFTMKTGCCGNTTSWTHTDTYWVNVICLATVLKLNI